MTDPNADSPAPDPAHRPPHPAARPRPWTPPADKPKLPKAHLWLWTAAAAFVVGTIAFLLTIDHFYAPRQKPATDQVESVT